MRWLALCIAFFITAAHAGETPLITPQDIADNSTITGGNTYQLNDTQDYTVRGIISITGTAVPNLTFSGNGLTVDSNNGRVTVRQFTVDGGIINLTARSATALTTSAGVAVSGGVINAYGGASSGTYGLYAMRGVALSGSTLNAYGGSVNNSYGVNGYAYNIEVNSGAFLNAFNGSAAGAHGARSNTVVINGGTVNARGDTGGGTVGAYGLYAQTLRMQDGALNAQSGTVATTTNDSRGAYFFQVNHSGGIIQATGTTVPGGSATNVYNYGMYVLNYSHTGGTITAQGGGLRGIGLRVGSTLAVSGGGTITGTGGTGGYSTGLQAGSITVAEGSTVDMRGTGGAAGTNNAFGISTDRFIQSGGTITGTGGAGRTAYGIYASTLTLQGTGQFTGIGSAAAGDDGRTSAGANFYSGLTHSGQLLRGEGRFGAGIQTTNFTQTGGQTVVTAGSGAMADGLRVTGTAQLVGGTINATGGNGAASGQYRAASGLYARTFVQGGGSIQATGGSADQSHGLNSPSFTQNNGEIIADSGSETGAHGLNAATFTQIDGTVQATAGSTPGAYGMNAGTVRQVGGTITTAGGSASEAFGLNAATFTQDGGRVTSRAGTGVDGNGLNATDFVQNGGTVETYGGTAAGAHGLSAATYTINSGGSTTADSGVDNSYGLSVSELIVSGTLRMERNSRAGASVYASGGGTSPAVTLRSGSVLTPVVDLQGTTTTGSGLLATAAGQRVVIENGARVDPWFVDHRSIVRGTVYDRYLFMDTNTADGIDGFFNASGGLSLAYTTEKDAANGRYYLSVERVMDIPDVIALVPCENARRLMSVFDDLYDSGDELARSVISRIDHSRDMADLVAQSAHIGKTLTPTAYTKLTGTQLRTMELMQGNLFNHLNTLSKSANPIISSSSAYAASAVRLPGWQTWAEVLHQQSSRFESTCGEFDSPKEKFYGISTGVGRNFGSITLAAAFSYVGGSYRSDYTDTSVHNYGLNMGMKVHNLLPSGGWFNPWLSLSGGYVFADVNQKALSYSRNAWKRSDPHVHMGRVSMEAGNDFFFGPVTLSPHFGVGYAVIHQGGYREKDPSGYGLRVKDATFRSLRPRFGLAVGLIMTDRIDFGLHGSIRYETMDKRSAFTYSRLSVPGISLIAEGEKRKRVSGTLGADLQYRLSERIGLSLRYDLLLEDKYVASRFTISAGLSF